MGTERARGHNRILSRRSALALSAGTASVFAIACRGGSPPKPAEGGSPSTAKPQAGGVLNQANKYDPPTFDPGSRHDRVAQVLTFTSDQLLTYKTAPDLHFEQTLLTSSLADRWETPDAQTYTFHLHPGVTFANLPPVGGRALTSADVRWTLDYLSRTDQFKGQAPLPSAAMFEGLDSIDTPDPATVVVRFSKPFAPFPANVASEFSSIQAHEIFDQDGGFDKRVVGSGPWQIDRGASQQGSRWVFQRNPTYYRAGLPYIDQLNQIILADDATTNAALQARQVDMLDPQTLNADIVQQLQRALPGLVVFPFLAPEGWHVYMNTSRPPLDDERVRKAFALTVDRDELIKVISNGKGQWALSGSMPSLFTPEETRAMLPHDPAQAKQLLDAAGYGNGVDIEVIYPGEKYGRNHLTILQLLQAQLKTVGMNLTLKNLPEADESNSKRKGTFQIEISAKELAGDLDDVIFEVFYSKSSGNYGRINDPDLDAFVLAQRQEPDAAKRRQLWRQIAQHVVDRTWSIDLFYSTQYMVWQSYLKDYYPNMGFRGWPLMSSWLAKY